MAIHRTWLLVAAAIAAASPVRNVFGQGPAQNGVDAAATKTDRPAIAVGVVDLEKAIDRYPVAVRERDRLQKLSEQYSAELDALGQNIEELRAAMSLHRPGSLEHDQKQLELKLAMNQREGLAGLRKKQFDQQLEEFELAVYEDLEFAIARVAEDRNVAIVLRAQNSIAPAEDGAEDSGLQKARLMQFNRRTVWYTSPEVDLTPFLIKYLQVFDPRAERAKAKAAKKGDGKSKGSAKPDGK